MGEPTARVGLYPAGTHYLWGHFSDVKAERANGIWMTKFSNMSTTLKISVQAFLYNKKGTISINQLENIVNGLAKLLSSILEQNRGISLECLLHGQRFPRKVGELADMCRIVLERKLD